MYRSSFMGKMQVPGPERAEGREKSCWYHRTCSQVEEWLLKKYWHIWIHWKNKPGCYQTANEGFIRYYLRVLQIHLSSLPIPVTAVLTSPTWVQSDCPSPRPMLLASRVLPWSFFDYLVQPDFGNPLSTHRGATQSVAELRSCGSHCTRASTFLIA